MENKKSFVKAMEYGKYLAFTLATLFVIFAQFIGGKYWITISLALFTVAFGFLFATLVIRLVELCDVDKKVKDMGAEVVSQSEFENQNKGQEQKVEVVNLKSEKIWTLVGAIFFGIFSIFTLVVLILL